MDQVRGSKVFLKFDMKSRYNQLCVKEGQEWLTAFNTPEGPFQLNIMTFGFMNVPPIFQCFVDNHIYKKPELMNHLTGYLDNGNVHNATLQEHIISVQHFLYGVKRWALHSTQRNVNSTKKKWTSSEWNCHLMALKWNGLKQVP